MDVVFPLYAKRPVHTCQYQHFEILRIENLWKASPTILKEDLTKSIGHLHSDREGILGQLSSSTSNFSLKFLEQQTQIPVL